MLPLQTRQNTGVRFRIHFEVVTMQHTRNLLSGCHFRISQDHCADVSRVANPSTKGSYQMSRLTLSELITCKWEQHWARPLSVKTDNKMTFCSAFYCLFNHSLMLLNNTSTKMRTYFLPGFNKYSCPADCVTAAGGLAGWRRSPIGSSQLAVLMKKPKGYRYTGLSAVN